jgi:16S rRNA (cytosine967-C5)-methyltransferase
MGTIPGVAARFAAWRVLHDVRHGVPFEVAFGRVTRDLGEDDRRLAHELAAGVFRQRTDLDRALAPTIARGLDSVRNDPLDILRLGAFQLLHLDKVPRHAAVHTSVAVARRLGGPRLAGFVNAVLRRVAGPVDDETAGDLATRHSHPGWLVERWRARYGDPETERLLEWNNRRPPLVLQPARDSHEQLRRRLTDAGIAVAAAPWGTGLVVDRQKPTLLPGFAEGAFVVQDPAQRLVARFLDPAPASLVYDPCAAPGGKALAIAPAVYRLIAADTRRGRLARLVANVARAGSANIAVIAADARRPPLRRADAVILDVPCLGTGTLARNPDARWRVSPEALERLVAQAAAFLDAQAQIVAPGGLLLFATCSLEPEENEAQIARFLNHHRQFRREPAATVPPELLTPQGDLVLLPHRHGTDGAYAARLRRTG